MKKGILIVLSFIGMCTLYAQRITPQQYIETYKDIAIAEMHRTGVPASIKLAQGLLESESGNGNLVKRSNNHFGIKCKSYWTGPSVSHDDDERGECFRKYDHAEESFRDHSDFLRNSERYASLFKLKRTDYKGWAYGLKKAGYATNPRYSKILIWQIEKYNLSQYDQMPDNREAMPDYAVNNDNTDAPLIVPAVQQSAVSDETPYDIAAVTKRNGLKAVYAVAGTSLLAIATKHKIDLAKLLDYNELEADGLIDEDSWIYLERKHKYAAQDFHIAEVGDTYYSIAQSHGVQLEKILEYNNIDEDDEVAPGTQVWLKDNGNTQSNPSLQVKTITHKVQQGEGLYAVARKYNVTVEDIRKLNGLQSDVLQVGQELIISK